MVTMNNNQKKLPNDKSYYPDRLFKNHASWAKAVKKRDNYTCQFSFGDIYRKHNGPLEADHILPKAYGGRNILSNGRTLCKNCHAQYLIEAEQKYYSKNLHFFYLHIRDFILGLFGQPKQLQYYALLDYLTGKKSFRKGQLDAIRVLTEKKKNLIFVSPTGSGKSIIYQIAGILSQDQTLVISPLMALQKNQVEFLWRKWVPATLINSSILEEERRKRLVNILNRSYSFVFAHPKQFLLKSNYTNEITLKTNAVLLQAHFGTLCIDEAHVVNNWGKQFIEEYAELLQLRKHYNISRTIMLSASLTKKMQGELVKNLFTSGDEPEIIVTGFYRPEINLFVENFNSLNSSNENRLQFIDRLLKENKGEKTIIFATTKNQVEEITLYLKSQGYNAEGFHSKLDKKDKTRIQNRFSKESEDDLDILICTSAFGMGINISNIHLAIHYSLPFSLNDYYQQFGRIGRDGQQSKAYLLHSINESDNLIKYIQSKQIEGMDDDVKKEAILKTFDEDRKDLLNYIESNNKWNFIVDYFGQKSQSNSTLIYWIIPIIVIILLIYKLLE